MFLINILTEIELFPCSNLIFVIIAFFNRKNKCLVEQLRYH